MAPTLLKIFRSSIKSRKMRWAGCVVRMGQMRNAHKTLVWKEGKRQLGRPRRRWGNIRVDP